MKVFKVNGNHRKDKGAPTKTEGGDNFITPEGYTGSYSQNYHAVIKGNMTPSVNK